MSVHARSLQPDFLNMDITPLVFEERQKQILDRDLEQAAEIQKTLLPDTAPGLPGYDIAGHNRQCRKVGGDYYDYIPLSGGRLGLVLADVSGRAPRD